MIYFIRIGDHGPVKIGRAYNPAARLSTLQGAHWQTLRLVRTLEGDRLVERRLHRHYADLALRGEWFSWDDSMMTIEPLAAGPDGPINEIIELFGGTLRVAEIVRVRPESICRWRRSGYLPVWHGPVLRQAAVDHKINLPWELVWAALRPSRVRIKRAA